MALRRGLPRHRAQPVRSREAQCGAGLHADRRAARVAATCCSSRSRSCCSTCSACINVVRHAGRGGRRGLLLGRHRWRTWPPASCRWRAAVAYYGTRIVAEPRRRRRSAPVHVPLRRARQEPFRPKPSRRSAPRDPHGRVFSLSRRTTASTATSAPPSMRPPRSWRANARWLSLRSTWPAHDRSTRMTGGLRRWSDA